MNTKFDIYIKYIKRLLLFYKISLNAHLTKVQFNLKETEVFKILCMCDICIVFVFRASSL